jgi:hypothetical protein
MIRQAFFSIYNYLGVAVYYYLIFGKSDSLPQKPGLTLFYNSELYVKDKLGNKIFGPIGQTRKRIDSYDISQEILSGKINDPHFHNGIKEISRRKRCGITIGGIYIIKIIRREGYHH